MPLSNEGACAIEKMLNEDYDDEDPRMVQKKDKIMEILAEADESYVAVIPPKQVGIHFGNRDGDGISDDGVHTRGSLIVSAGFSRGTIEQDTIAMEDDPDTRSIAKHTEAITSITDKLADIDVSAIRAGSLGASHGNQFLCCAIDEVPCDIPSLSENGKMSQDKIFRDKELQNACLKAVKWVVIRARVGKRFPKLAGFISAALNIRNHIAKGQPIIIIIMTLLPPQYPQQAINPKSNTFFSCL